MIPRFDKLTDSEKLANTALLADLGFETPDSAVQMLMRIRRFWLSVQETQTGTISPDNSGRSVISEQPMNVLPVPSGPVWYDMLLRVLREAPLRDIVLGVVEQFIRNASEQFNPYEMFEQTPRALDVLARVACGSPFLTQTLLADPACLTSLTTGGRTAEMKSRDQFVSEAEAAISVGATRRQNLTELRRFQRREMLRIGMCDAFGLLDLRFVTLQLSLLADAMVQVCLNLAARECGENPDSLAVVGLGKHGGEELNYSSDIDLILIARSDSSGIQRLARLTIDGLSDNLPPGFLYRVDLRLRPWGDAGPLVTTSESYSHYLRSDAALWEKQALLKARTVAGNAIIGRNFLETIRPLLLLETPEYVRTSIQLMKERIESRLRQRGKLNSEVKLGIGSIRDVEFLVQCLQLTHGREEPRILSFNTLDSLVRLAEFGLLSAAWYRQLREGYVFLRTLEHSLQLLHNQQTHEVPTDPRQREWLANRLDYPNAATLLQRFEEHQTAVRAIFEHYLGKPGGVHELPAERAQSLAAASIPAASVAPAERRLEERRIGVSQPYLAERERRQAIVEQLCQQTAGGPGAAAHCSAVAGEDGLLELIICGTEFSGWLSVICGLLSVYRLDIRSGDAMTGHGFNRYGLECPGNRFLALFFVRTNFGMMPESSPGADGEAAQARDGLSPLSAPVACGTIQRSPNQLSTGLQRELTQLIERAAAGQVEEIRAELISRFCETLPQKPVSDATLAAVEMTVRQDQTKGETQLNISGADVPGFLFELAHALFFSRFRTTRAMIDSFGDQVRDVLHVQERDGSPILNEARVQELRVVVVLIKQFTHWLPSTSDPHHALVRFRELITRLQPESQWTKNIQSLQQPNVLYAVARVLGISQFLWEDFLRSRHEELFPLLANAGELGDRVCRESLSLQLDELTTNVETSAQAWSALNNFKDRHLFRIDMRHVLGHCRPFGAFSEEITELADLVVCRSIDLAWQQLVMEFGHPMTARSAAGQSAGSDGSAGSDVSEEMEEVVCPFMVAGLGKFGGVEMGYASDIELMLIYSGVGQSSGANSVSNARFFDLLVTAIANGISARQDGIFQVDLRMRPFGQAGSAAVALSDFEAYYGPDGPAWPYERQALVKFRAVSGNRQFAAEAMAICHRAVYSSGQFDFTAMRAMRERQIRQLVRGGTVNAKLSDGGLVDCEYAVQALQLTFGTTLPELRHSNTRRVLGEAARLSLISPRQRMEVEDAYVFLRELIDCLRMVRGNARDLTIPNPGSPDYQQLARRMQSIHDSRIPLEDLETQMQIVRRFSREVEQHCRAMRMNSGATRNPSP